MSDLARTFKRMSFAGVEFPFVEYTVRGSLRHHVHEYMYAPGGEIEDLARRLYEITVTLEMHDIWVTYPKLWPEGLQTLRLLYERGEVRPLVIPSIGTIEAKCIDWEQRMTRKILSGEKCTWKFLESARSETLSTGAVPPSLAALEPLAAQLLADAEALDVKDPFEAIAELCNSLVAFGDQVELAGSLLDSKLQAVVQAGQALDRKVTTLGEAQGHALLNSLHELTATAQQLRKDTLKRALPIQLFPVPATMTVGQVASILYDDMSRAADLLRINDFDDALAIPPNTMVRFYPDAA